MAKTGEEEVTAFDTALTRARVDETIGRVSPLSPSLLRSIAWLGSSLSQSTERSVRVYAQSVLAQELHEKQLTPRATLLSVK